ncbi:MAG: hypothetical protein ACXWLO_11785 [Rhizomicrobium sp.]
MNNDAMTALKVAAMQQELMVAALTCHEVARYNHFVLSRQPELIDSDNRLKAYFVQRSGSEAGYHTFKSELANASSLRSVRAADLFCARADSEFDLADRQMSLSALVGMQSFALGAAYQSCPGRDRNAPVTADASPALPSRQSRLASVRAGAPDPSADSLSADSVLPPSWTPARRSPNGDRENFSDTYARADGDSDEDDAGLQSQKRNSAPHGPDRYARMNPDRDGYARDRFDDRSDDEDSGDDDEP